MDYKKLDSQSITSSCEKKHVVDVNEELPAPNMVPATNPRKCCRWKKLMNRKITVKHILIFLVVYYVATCVNEKFGITWQAGRMVGRVMDKIGQGLADLFGYEKSPLLVIDPYTKLETYRWRHEIENDPLYRSQLDKLDGKI